MTARADTVWDRFAWTPQPDTAQFVDDLLARFAERLPLLEKLGRRLREESGTRLTDWLDHISLPPQADTEHKLRQVGFEPASASDTIWRHQQGLFPAIRLDARSAGVVALRVESVADFLVAQGFDHVSIEGSPLSALRRARLATAGDGSTLWVIERHGCTQFEVGQQPDEAQCAELLHYGEAFRRRRRQFEDDADGFSHARQSIAGALDALGIDRACDLFFAAEREFWQRRNRAAKIQKARQDALGVGWANHDHHTYRSSRQQFTRLIAVLEQLGFQCRERFYGGHGAGWGAQVLEQPQCEVVIFADVDLTPEEVTGDFAHEPLPPVERLGTVGLWCALHGEAFLQAGMHHLECRFDFDAARQQLAALGVASMKPFTDFPFLKQAFTEADTWPVEGSRIERALAAGLITREQAERFGHSGALGSHLEILERNDGYKGFNQTGISEIILSTDPRRQQ